jgi:hypothetical protein
MLVLLEEAGSPVACTAHPWDLLLARWHAFRLDSDLAAGVSPDASLPLALRARMLLRPRYRYELARSADRVLATAMHGANSGPPRVPVCRDRVRDCSAEFGELIRRLRAPGPISVRGVAKIGVLLADAGGPLYHRANTDDLCAWVRDAADALIAALP